MSACPQRLLTALPFPWGVFRRWTGAGPRWWLSTRESPQGFPAPRLHWPFPTWMCFIYCFYKARDLLQPVNEPMGWLQTKQTNSSIRFQTNSRAFGQTPLLLTPAVHWACSICSTPFQCLEKLRFPLNY